MNELVKHEGRVLVAIPTDDEIERMYRIAKALALSGMFKDARQAEQAFALIVIGRDLGLSPAQSMTGIHIVEGKPMMHYAMLGTFVREREGCDYRVTEHTDEACSIEFFRDGESLGVSRFTMEDAKRAGLGKPTRNGQPSNWVKLPRNMLYARAMSNGVRWFTPEALGGIPVYVEGEIVEGTAAEIASGHGDGSEPGWGATSVENAAAVEAIIERAQALGHAGLSDRATAQMTLSGQPDSVVAMWISRARTELDEFEGRSAAQIVQDEADSLDAAEARADEMPHIDDTPSPDALRDELGQVLDRIAAEEEAGADDAVMAPLYAEQERLEGLLGDEPGDEGQETMPL
jgi:hypothetical protein